MRNFTKGVLTCAGFIVAPVFLFFGWIGGIFAFVWATIHFLGFFIGGSMDSSEEALQKWNNKKAKEDAEEERDRRQQRVGADRAAIKRILLSNQEKVMPQRAMQEEMPSKNSQHENYKAWRLALEKMPKYETWRQHVFSKYGRRCERGGEIENLEIHHKKSLYSIYTEEGYAKIMPTDGPEKALDKTIGSKQLWDVDNGAVLCHECHERMDSSQKRKELSEG